MPQAQLVVTKLRAAQLELERDEQLMAVRRLTATQQHAGKGEAPVVMPPSKPKSTSRRRFSSASRASAAEDTPAVAGLT